VYRVNGVLQLPTSNFKDAAKTIRSMLGTATFFTRFTVNPSSLEFCNMLYAEKQVLSLDDNFPSYVWGRRLPLAGPSPRIPRHLNVLYLKSFSGDVSGDIGEALFVSFLFEVLGLPGDRVRHLYPERKRNYVTPDFFIQDENGLLHGLIGEPYVPSVYAEVKSSTGSMEASRIEKGLGQLRRVIRFEHGLLCLVHRPEEDAGYVVHVVVVKK